MATLVAQQGAAFSTGPVPTVDGTVLPESVYTRIRAGTHNRVPVMQGTTRDEYRYFVASAMLRSAFNVTDATSYSSWVSTTFSPLLTGLTAVYPIASYANAGEAAGALGTDVVFACNGRNSALELAQHDPVYSFEFRDRTVERAMIARRVSGERSDMALWHRYTG